LFGKRVKCVVVTLLFCISVSLSAQTARDIPLYIPPVEGAGSTPEDNEIFKDILLRELEVWNFNLVETREEADFTLSAAFSPSYEDAASAAPPTSADADVEDTPAVMPPAAGEYLLSLSLLDKENEILYQQTLRYTSMKEIYEYIPSMLFNMLSSFFVMYAAEPAPKATTVLEEFVEDETDPDEWRNKLWYIGETVFWSPRFYYGSFVSGNLANFGIGFSAEYHFLEFAYGRWEFLKYVAASTGMEFIPDWVAATDRAGDEYHNTILQIPLRFSYVWRYKDIYMHQPFLGIHFNIPFYRDTSPAVVSWDIGFQFGMKAGPGIAYAQGMYSMDFGKSGLDVRRNDERAYRRYIMQFGVGYKYDLVSIAVDFLKDKIPKLPKIPWPWLKPAPADITEEPLPAEDLKEGAEEAEAPVAEDLGGAAEEAEEPLAEDLEAAAEEAEEPLPAEDTEAAAEEAEEPAADDLEEDGGE